MSDASNVGEPIVGVDPPERGRSHSFLPRYIVTHTARYEGRQLSAAVDRDKHASDVWADTAYRSQANLVPQPQTLQTTVSARSRAAVRMAAHIDRSNATRTQIRARVEHVFAALTNDAPD
jgi:hypothetical protein